MTKPCARRSLEDGFGAVCAWLGHGREATRRERGSAAQCPGPDASGPLATRAGAAPRRPAGRDPLGGGPSTGGGFL